MLANRIAFTAVLALLGIHDAYACDHPVGTIVSTEGTVEVRSVAEGPAMWTPARLQQTLCANDQIAVRERSRAAVELINQIVVRLDQHTTLTLQKLDADQPAEIGLLEGIVHVLTRFTHKFSVITPYLNAMVEGTEFTVLADTQAQRGQITVAEGKVRAANQYGEQVLVAGNTVAASATDAPPVALMIKPRDAIQWALYFPQIINVSDAALAKLDSATSSRISSARALADRGQYQQALATLGNANEYLAEPVLQVWYANLLLSVGRLDEARELLNFNDSNSARQLPLRSLIETVLSNSDQALLLARQAITEQPDSAAAQLALSLALQAQGEISQALTAAQRATELDAGFPLGWVRVAELELLNANARQGLIAAQHALQLNQSAAKAHTVIGFAEIMAGHYEQAHQAFERAKQTDVPDAQAWLGSGLVLIHDGQLAEGRRHLEIAAMLDPGNAELRNILTRAYLKEGRDGVATKELELAERLDPDNPGPWFTDALRKQQRNDPVGALQSYQQSLALNDQRAVVRPRTLLDQDKAGRMLSLASTYRDLGFDGLMLDTAERAVAADPNSSAAHAFLAEAYSATPRYETARVSEQLQSQLRAPIGMAPIAPQSLLTTLPIVGGPRAFTLQEFTPLLDRNNGGLQLGGLLGTQTTRGSSATAFKAWDTVQISAGHFYYDTDAAINDVPIRLSANNLLFQWQLTPTLQAQLEGRTERRDGGDVTQRIDPLSAEPERRRYLKNDSARFGLAYAPSTQTEWLVHAFYGDQLAVATDVSRQSSPAVTVITHSQLRKPAEIAQIESQVRHRSGRWETVLGGGIVQARSTIRNITLTELSISFPGFPSLFDEPSNVGVNHAYANLDTSYRLGGLNVTAGMSWDNFRRKDGFSVQRGSPKLGGEYAWKNTRLRAALFSGVKGSAAQEQSLVPALFNGFTQVFDDLEGTRYRRAAVAVDHEWREGLSSGIEWSLRKLDVPNWGCISAPCTGLWREYAHRLYNAWTISSHWALGADVLYDHSRLEQPDNYPFPIQVRTWQAPLKLTFFVQSNWRFDAEWRGVKQTVRNRQLAGPSVSQTFTVDSSFGVVNLGVRYGLPTGRWSLSLEANNVFDREVRFQATTIDGRPTVPVFAPTRIAALRFGLRL